MNILSIYTSHDGAITVSKDNELIVHCEISRFNKFKHSPLPNYEIIKKIAELGIVFDVVLISELSDNLTSLWKSFLFSKRSGLKFFRECLSPKAKIIISKNHHAFHAACAKTFKQDTDYLVWDGNGALVHLEKNIKGVEKVSFYNNNLKTSTKYLYNPDPFNYKKGSLYTSPNNLGIGEAYTFLTRELGLYEYDNFSESKAMAFSSFGKYDEKYINDIIYNNNFNRNIIAPFFDYNLSKKVTAYKDFNTEKGNNDAMNFSYTFQKACEFMAREYFKKLNIHKPVTLAGGVTQNILINTDLSLFFNFDIFYDPICNDQGISLGHLNYHTENKIQRPDHCYLGFNPIYNLEIFSEKFKIVDATPGEIAKILFEDPVAIFQGRSEQGQRALGNRSLLMNATNLRCIDKINLIKKREWYRPFACTIMSEYFEKYFIRDSNRSAEFMMNVFRAQEQKKEHLQNVLCPQGTSRVQELKQEKNNNFYNLLKAFNDMYQIPFLLNTSLNKPGSPIVESLEDLKSMMLETNLKYSYLPEKRKLVIKNEI
jgi:carbamoyltransferase